MIRLRRELERAVQREEYEEAARLRDRIRTLAGNPDAANGTL
jgi:protein-arginine kinase activator protein McsA